MAKELLTPVEIVEVGQRLTQKRIEGLGMTALVEDARIFVDIVVGSLEAVAKPLGLPQGGIRRLALGESYFYRPYDYARSDPRVGASIQGAGRFDPLSVRFGKRRARRPNASLKAKALVLDRHQILVLGDPNPDRVYLSWTAAAKAIGASPQAFWKRFLGSYKPDQRLR